MGIMVATGLNCATAAHLLDLTPSPRAPHHGCAGTEAFCDLDGNLLVAESSQRRFVGGIEWRHGEGGFPCGGGGGGGGIGITLLDGAGHGVTERSASNIHNAAPTETE